ncbi:hypothetical protein P3X46_012014 [Hevea brasiliensis]|uniref:HMA domain-containing protein n=1 Tax=Hevea brasiliensis TaxID=3981 RepID=A0ABQ9M8X7_HEVBR|nr:heavy metal-associated isoprenylated plant protein 41-like [Hevea brasiliensis]KAJ9176732.1 hypothetical protein P3X46_012014 [Hevea brasiliensis]
MEQKIVIKICMPDQKSRSKAMQTAVSFSGVASVAISKDDHMEVKGIGVDPADLINCLRKRFATKTSCLEKRKGFATLVSVEEIKKPPPKPPEPTAKDKPKPPGPVCGQCGCCMPCPCGPCRRPMYVCVEEYPKYCSKDCDTCSIM